MKTNPNQLELDFARKDMVVSSRIACEHDFYTDEDTEHEVCGNCGLCVPHDYIVEKLDINDWPDNAV